MQSLFVVVILSPSFLGEPFESEIQIARMAGFHVLGIWGGLGFSSGFRGLGFSSGFRGLGFRVSLGIHPHEFSS